MSGIQFVTDEKGRKVGVLIDLKITGPSGRTSGTVLCPNRAGRKRAFRTNNTARPAWNAPARVAKYSIEIKQSAQKELDALDDA